MKEGSRSKLFASSLVVFLGVVLSISFVLAVHVIRTSTGGTSYNINEDTTFFYNISVNNSEALDINITQVNITLPSGFVFTADSNKTSAGTHIFTNTSSVLTWNSSSLVANVTVRYFGFNATASTPGIYNLTVITSNSSGSFGSNITITINDTTVPSTIDFVSPTESNNSNISRSFIRVNVTATDNGAIATIRIRLFNSTRTLINGSTISSTSPLFINFTGLSDGVYYFNATVNDTYGNSNSTSTRSVVIDTVSPTVSLIAPVNATSSATDAYNFTFNVTDGLDLSSCSLILDGAIVNTLTSVNRTGATSGIYYSSISAAAHPWSVNCTDNAGNIGASPTYTITVTSSSSSSSSSDDDDSNSGSGDAYPTFSISEDTLGEGYTKSMQENWRLSFRVDGERHALGVKSISSSSVRINVSSELQEATLSIGETKKFELSGDRFYDLLVKLNAINQVRGVYQANLTMERIHEEMNVESSQASDTVQQAPLTEEGSSHWMRNTMIFLILVALVVASGFAYKKYKNNKYFSFGR